MVDIVKPALSRGALLALWSEEVLEPAARWLLSRVNDWLSSRGRRPSLNSIGGRTAPTMLLLAVVRPHNLDRLIKNGVRPRVYDVRAAFDRADAFDPDLADWVRLTGPSNGPRLNALRRI